MNRAPVSAPATLPRDDRLHLMRQKSIKQLPLVDEGGHLVVVETLDELLEPAHYQNPVLIMVFCLVTWTLQYFLVLEKRHRTVFPAVGQLMGLTSKSS